MPVQVTYPGVYIEELPSGVHTITGVATSITAFVGRAQRGPVNTPYIINSYSDYDRIFGGLWQLSSMSFAVNDFFANGGVAGRDRAARSPIGRARGFHNSRRHHGGRHRQPAGAR